MIVGIIDIGSNTARLLVADVNGTTVTERARDRVYLRLGDDVHAHGAIGPAKLAATRDVARRFARAARKAGAKRLRTIVTAPARQSANGDQLVALLADATAAPAEALSGDDEGRLAWSGAVARMEGLKGDVAVVDLGGGSTELAVGRVKRGPEWVRSADAGALRVTRVYLSGDEPLAEQAEVARTEILHILSAFDPPAPDTALVVGGTARAIGRILGERFDAAQLDALVEILEKVPGDTFVRSHGVSAERAHTLLGGTLVLAEISRLLDSPLEVGRGGLREGAALALATSERAAA